jgi:hypothetical protein
MDVVMELYNERPISVQLPDQVEATIVEGRCSGQRSDCKLKLQAGRSLTTE